MPRHGRCAFCLRAAREVAAAWSWEVAGRRRLRDTQSSESLAVCTEHARRLEIGRLLLLRDRAYGLRERSKHVPQVWDSDDPRQQERRYLREAGALGVDTRSDAARCVAMTPSGARCRHRVTRDGRWCAQHALLRRRGLPVVDADG